MEHEIEVKAEDLFLMNDVLGAFTNEYVILNRVATKVLITSSINFKLEYKTISASIFLQKKAKLGIQDPHGLFWGKNEIFRMQDLYCLLEEFILVDVNKKQYKNANWEGLLSLPDKFKPFLLRDEILTFSFYLGKELLKSIDLAIDNKEFIFSIPQIIKNRSLIPLLIKTEKQKAKLKELGGIECSLSLKKISQFRFEFEKVMNPLFFLISLGQFRFWSDKNGVVADFENRLNSLPFFPKSLLLLSPLWSSSFYSYDLAILTAIEHIISNLNDDSTSKESICLAELRKTNYLEKMRSFIIKIENEDSLTSDFLSDLQVAKKSVNRNW